MRNMQEIEIVHVDEETKQATAFAFNPDFISNDNARDIVSKQIDSAEPIEIHCVVGTGDSGQGIFVTKEADEFVRAKNLTDSEKQDFIDKAAGLIKGDRTFHVILSKAYEEPERKYELDPSKFSLKELHRISNAQIKAGRLVNLYKVENKDITRRTLDFKGVRDLPEKDKKKANVAFVKAMRKSDRMIISNR